jgi:hypothetical protein
MVAAGFAGALVGALVGGAGAGATAGPHAARRYAPALPPTATCKNDLRFIVSYLLRRLR